MDGLSSAASVIAVIQITKSIVELCGGYLQQVKGARDEILMLQQAITSLQGTLQDLQTLVQNNTGNALPTSSRLAGHVTDCLADLRALETRLDQGKGKKLMRKVGWRALKWPLQRKDMEGLIQNLERYKSSFVLSLQVDQSSLMVGKTQDMVLEKLEGVLGADFESFDNRDDLYCLQGTRTKLLHQIIDWANSPSQNGIFWLKGMAGTGKSTISRTVARSFKSTNQLGASFFFKRGEADRGNARKFFPTLTRQLMLRIPGLRSSVQKVLHDDPDIISKSLSEQFEKLLLQPLLTLDPSSRTTQATMIVIDALDECEHDRDIRNIIRLLPSLHKAKTVALRVFVTSRIELPLSLGFSDITDHKYQDLALHEIPENVTEHDIRLFLQDRFAKIKSDKHISEDWPGDNVIQKLVVMSAPLFISAATICRYIESSKLEPKSRLAELLVDQAKYVSKMDKTYLPILTRLLNDQECDELEQQQLLQEFQDIIGVIILLTVPLSINALSVFLGIGVDKISNRLDSFRSVLSFPNGRDQPVRILHLSFRDFLVQSRTKFLVDEPKQHKEITKHCLKIMQNHLKKDICNLGNPGTRRVDIDPQIIHQYLPPELQYSCHYWIYHLKESQALSSEIKNVRLFLQKYFLHWVEAMSLLGLISEVVGMLDHLHTDIPGDDNYMLVGFLLDAKRFVLKNRQIASEAPLQIYCAGLIFAPHMAIVRTEFKQDIPSWICQLPRVSEIWSAELQTLEGHSGTVHSVAFTPDGRLLASASCDSTVRLWDPATGALEQTLEGHSAWVRSVAFSPDGRLLASGSDDMTVRLWDPATGTLERTLEDACTVHSVAFSPDGRLLASGSNDTTVRLWDTATGALEQTLEGHSVWARSVAFSPDGQLLASAYDMTVKLWDLATGTIKQTIEGHVNEIRSVAFSPDSRLLASGSDDTTVRLWDPATGTLKQVLEGFPEMVMSVAFSPDDRLLAFGSDSNTVQLWDPATGTLEQTLKGHSGTVQSVAFSPDGRLLASGSDDKTVRLWNLATGALEQTVEHHLEAVRSVAFSPDGRLLVSRSYDMTMGLWDPATGALEHTFEDDFRLAHSVLFSPDGRLLVSASDDYIVRLWDPATGALEQTFKGHSARVLSVAFSPDGRLLASGSDDKTVRLWNLATGTLEQTVEHHLEAVNSVAFSPDGRLLASGSDDMTVRLWDPATGALEQTLKGHSGRVHSVAFSPDSRLLASGSDDTTVRLWDPATGALEQTFKSHSDGVLSVAFSPDGHLLASSSIDRTVRLWDLATGALEEIFHTEEIVTKLEFSRDGSSLSTDEGIFKIQSRCGNPILNSPSTNLEISIENDCWITLNGNQVLWLPPEARPTSLAVRSNTLVLGHASGRVSFMSFRI